MMTVSELIKLLNDFGSDKRVFVEDYFQTSIQKICDVYLDSEGDLIIRGGNYEL